MAWPGGATETTPMQWQRMEVLCDAVREGLYGFLAGESMSCQTRWVSKKRMGVSALQLARMISHLVLVPLRSLRVSLWFLLLWSLTVAQARADDTARQNGNVKMYGTNPANLISPTLSWSQRCHLPAWAKVRPSSTFLLDHILFKHDQPVVSVVFDSVKTRGTWRKQTA